jgi:hypothetical protein
MKLFLFLLMVAGVIAIPVGIAMILGPGAGVLVAGILAVLFGAGASYDPDREKD